MYKTGDDLGSKGTIHFLPQSLVGRIGFGIVPSGTTIIFHRLEMSDGFGGSPIMKEKNRIHGRKKKKMKAKTTFCGAFPSFTPAENTRTQETDVQLPIATPPKPNLRSCPPPRYPSFHEAREGLVKVYFLALLDHVQQVQERPGERSINLISRSLLPIDRIVMASQIWGTKA